MSQSTYGTHIVPLLISVLNTTGTVIELGMGDFSTPLLHEICKLNKRKLISAETSNTWMTRYDDLKSPFHIFKHVPVYKNENDDSDPKSYLWDEIGKDEDDIGVVFVDNRPGERRKDDIRRFANRAKIVVVHDTEAPSYEYETVFSLFKYRFDYRKYIPYTTVVSNYIDVNTIFEN